MSRTSFYLALLVICTALHPARAAAPAPGTPGRPPVYIWLEPEWFPEVTGHYDYWTGPGKSQPTGSWQITGPGISAEWTQGGESGWNSMGAAPEETHAVCHRDLTIPRAGHYKVWVRYVDHRKQTSPFTIQVAQGGKAPISGELGVSHVLSPGDEYELYWGFSFGWAAVEGDLSAGPAAIRLVIDKPGQSWRQVDAILITDDLGYQPVGREKPTFAYFKTMGLEPHDGAAWRGTARGLTIGSHWQLKPIAGHDFTMWTDVTANDAKWWPQQDPATLTAYDVLFHYTPPTDILDEFHKQFAGRKDLPIMSWPGMVPGFYLGEVPDLAPDTPVNQWLTRSHTPFFIMTNYANPAYTAQTGPATYHALTGPLANQFLGYIHGESMSTLNVDSGTGTPMGKTRREQVDAVGKRLVEQQAAAWSKYYKTAVPESHIDKSIPCLSCDDITYAHLFHEIGCQTVGFEVDSTEVNVPMRIAFERGAARQYAGSWLNYASSNFGDSCNYFTQKPGGGNSRGADSWYVNKYAITDGVSAAWYNRLYYLNYLSGAGAIYWEEGQTNHWMKPGPGQHPVGLSPFGRATVDFQAFVSRLPDRGQPYTPIAFLLSYGHGYDAVNYTCKMLGLFPEDDNDRELRELFNVAWFPVPILEGQPQAPDVQSIPHGVYGNIFDVLVDRPQRAAAVMNYPVVWAAGDADLGGAMGRELVDYVHQGGTLVVNAATLGDHPAGPVAALLGLTFTAQHQQFESWVTGPNAGAQPLATTPYEVEQVRLTSAKALAWAGPGVPLIVRNQVGPGAVIVTLVPHMLGIDERAHPALPYLMNGLTQDLMPVEVVTPQGQRLTGQVMVQINKTRDGYVVGLLNGRGIDKTPSGVARVDRRQFADVVIRTKLPVATAKEYTQPHDLAVVDNGPLHEVAIRVEAGDVQVVGLVTK